MLLRSSRHPLEPPVSKTFIASFLQKSLDITGVAANQASEQLITFTVRDLKKAT